MEDPSVSILASLSLPGNSEAISLQLGAAVRSQGENLKSGVERSRAVFSEEEKGEEEQVRESTGTAAAAAAIRATAYAHVSYLKGTSASVVPVSKTYLNMDSMVHGAPIGGVLTLPQTRGERDVAIAAIKEAMDNVEESAKESSDLLNRIVGIMEETKGELPPEERPGEPKVRTPEEEEMRRELIQPAEAPGPEKRVADLRQRALTKTKIITSAWDLMRRPSPSSIADAIFMVLHTSEGVYGLSGYPYTASLYLSDEATLMSSDEISAEGWAVSVPQPGRTFSVHNLVTDDRRTAGDIKRGISSVVTRIAPTVTFTSKLPKTIDVEIPVDYALSSVDGLPASNRLLGFSVYIRVTVAIGLKKDSPTQQMHIFLASERLHSEILKEGSSLSVSVTKDGIDLGYPDATLPWKGTANLFGTKKNPRPWRAVSANVTRVYLSHASASVEYVKFQEIDLGQLHQASVVLAGEEEGEVMTFGHAADLKEQRLLSMVQDKDKIWDQIPVDYVTDHDIIGKNLSKQ